MHVNEARANPREYRPLMATDTILLFVCGDVMLGRGIDQILPHPKRPGAP